MLNKLQRDLKMMGVNAVERQKELLRWDMGRP